MYWSNYINSLEFDLREALLAKAELQKLETTTRINFERASEEAKIAIKNREHWKEKHRDAANAVSMLSMRIGETQSERFENCEDEEAWFSKDI